MGLVQILGNLLLSVAGSVLANKMETLAGNLKKRRKKKRARSSHRKGS